MAVEGYDIIGDVHGHADEFEGLLRMMGYVPRGRGYRPPVGRQVVFLGDLIDHGPQQLSTSSGPRTPIAPQRVCVEVSRQSVSVAGSRAASEARLEARPRRQLRLLDGRFNRLLRVVHY